LAWNRANVPVLKIPKCETSHPTKTLETQLEHWRFSCSPEYRFLPSFTVYYRGLSHSIPPEYPLAFHSAFSGQSLTLPLRFFTP
jgi:hypothetical protein